MSQAHQEMYECVQPLQGHISFTDYGRTNKGDADTPYGNTLSLNERAKDTPTHFENKDVDNLVGVVVAALITLCAILWGVHDTQYAFNAVTLTQFAWKSTSTSYALEYAGHTKPLYCLIIALGLLTCSLVLG
jgi:hypothetical protein